MNKNDHGEKNNSKTNSSSLFWLHRQFLQFSSFSSGAVPYQTSKIPLLDGKAPVIMMSTALFPGVLAKRAN